MSNELLQYVREVGEQLCGDLEEARQRSENWDDANNGYPLVASALDKSMESLAATSIWGKDNQLPSGELWREAEHFLTHGPLQLRARTKPLGYAGDHEMLRMIYDQEISAHPLGRLLDRYFQGLDAPEAVRGRLRIAGASAAAHVAAQPARDGRPFQLLSVGSGPAIDVELALRQLKEESSRALEVTLLDLDPGALQAAQQRLAPLLPDTRLHCHRENLFRLPRRAAQVVPAGSVDFLVCLGLFDYLEAADAAAMLRTFWTALRSGGQMMVGNFAPHCRSRAYMEWIGNWYLIYRERDQMIELATASGIPVDCVRIEAEDQGVNLLWVATRPAWHG